MRWINKVSIFCVALVLILPAAVLAEQDAVADGQRLYKLGRYDEALQDWRDAAEAGDTQAAYQLALAYEDGIVTLKNIKESRRWFRIAADKGHPAAQFEIGSIYDFGVGVPVAPEIAASWYIRAALQGYDPAAYNLATLYETGTGVIEDPVEAYKLFVLVSDGTFSELAREGMTRLEAQLDPIQLAEAEKRAALFTPHQEGE